MPQLRVWLDFLAGNQSAAAAVTMAAAVSAIQVEAIWHAWNQYFGCFACNILDAAPPALCGQLSLTFERRAGDSPQVPAGRAQLQIQLQFFQFQFFPVTISHAEMPEQAAS